MIGNGLKKLATENGMQIAKGVAYGSLGGFAATMSEGSGYKQICFATAIRDAVMLTEFQTVLNGRNVRKDFRVNSLAVAPKSIQVVFQDTVGTMKKIREFLEWFLPLLRQYGATPVNVCPECGCEVVSGRWLLVEGAAYHLHDSCAQKVKREIETDNTRRTEEDHGSYPMGFLGALAGSVLGAILWAIVLNLGYIASVVGLAIGWLAEKGYNLLHGKQGKGKIAILIVVIIFGVLLGTFAADAFTLAGMINGGELPGFALGDIPLIIFALLMEDAEYAGATGSNILMGLLFAALGVFALLRQAGKDVSGTKWVDLN